MVKNDEKLDDLSSVWLSCSFIGQKVSFCRLTKGITPEICGLCVYVIINKRSLESFIFWDLVLER